MEWNPLCIDNKHINVSCTPNIWVSCSNAFEDPELGFSDRQHSEAAPLSHPSPYDRGQKTAGLQLQDRPQK